MTSAWRNLFGAFSVMLALGVAGVLSLQLSVATAPASDEACPSCSLEPALFQKNAAPGQGASQRIHVGFRECLRCHNSGMAGGLVELPGGGKIEAMKEQWVFYKEYPIWAKEDKHGQAYTVLLNERSKAMGKLLGVAEIHRDQRCLACHTGFPLHEMPVEKDGLVGRDLSKNLDINLGVSCEGCHGAGGDVRADNKMLLQGWYLAHQVTPRLPYERTKPWRFLSPREKRDEYGFTDVRSPASKTKLCASCHIGDVERGRIVTHEMHAAGHPPLPGFEIETFATQMPRHWAEFSAKSNDVQDLFLKFSADPLYKEASYQKKSLHRTRSLLTGAAVASAEYLRLAGQLADETVKSPVKREAWPELAVFDCYACHHELKGPGWRQMRKPPLGVPGRPPLQEWPFTLARIALKIHGIPAADVEARLADLRKALAAQPFGNPKDIAKPARDAAAWFHARAQDLERKHLIREQGIALLKEIAAVASTEALDYDSARQLVWAFQVISGDLKTDYAEAKKVAGSLDLMGKDIFLLDLRAGRKAATSVPGDKQARNTVEVDLELVLPIISRYEPARFQQRFKEIASLLK